MENKGFTLIEVLIVIAIIGILAAIALPSYQEHVRKSNRIDLQLEMTKLSLVAERQFARQNTYPASGTLDLSDVYSASIASTSNSFIITAEPISSQANDSCGTMTLNQASITTAVKGGVAIDGCW